ncbi:MAG: hypothetical protein LBQ10_02410 [Desulfovibrio sp.]|nr:hypothetical protein [Desulfovibrio sp.]
MQTEVGHAGSGAFSRHAPADGATAVLPPSSAPAGVARRAPLLVAGQGAWSRASLSDESLLDMLGLTRLPIPAIGGVRAVAAAALDLPAPATSQDAPSPFAPAEQTAPLTMPGAPPIPANIPRGQNSSGAPLAPRGNGQGMLPPLPSASDVPAVPQLTPNIAPQAMPEDPNAKAQELARQQQDILMLRQQMDERLKDIETAEQKMQDMIREAKGLEEKKVRHLIQVYANMKPKVAAKAIESLDERVAVRILSGMVPKQSGEILTYTNPEKTAKLTELLTRIRMPE